MRNQPSAQLGFASWIFWVEESGSPSRARTYDKAINSRLLYQLSYRGTLEGAPYTATFGSCKPLMRFDCSKLQIKTSKASKNQGPKKSGEPLQAPR